MPALAILTGDGGSWHARHLKLRAAFARQAAAAAEWAIQHVPGEHWNKAIDCGAFELPQEPHGHGKVL